MIATLFFAHGRIRKRIFWAHHTTPSRTPRLAPFQSSRRHVSRCQPCFLDSQLVQPPASTIPQSKRVFRWPHQISAPAHPYRIMASRGHAGGRGGGEGRDGAVSAAAASWARRASRAVPARPSHFRAARSSRLASDSIARRPASSCSYSPALRCVSSTQPGVQTNNTRDIAARRVISVPCQGTQDGRAQSLGAADLPFQACAKAEALLGGVALPGAGRRTAGTWKRTGLAQ